MTRSEAFIIEERREGKKMETIKDSGVCVRENEQKEVKEKKEKAQNVIFVPKELLVHGNCVVL